MERPDPLSIARDLPCWSGHVEPKPLAGGLSNTNFLVRDRGSEYVVRVGEDIVFHHVYRKNEAEASRAAARIGLSPEVSFVAKGALVLRFIENARPLTPADLKNERTLDRAINLVRRCHRELPHEITGPAPFFWVFHVIRDYARQLDAAQSRHRPLLSHLLESARILEKRLGPIEIVFGHNDLLPANLIDDGDRLWLIDWEYAGYNSPLFDLGGLASGTVYHFRVIASNAGGVATGADETFTTSGSPPAKATVTTSAASGVTSRTASQVRDETFNSVHSRFSGRRNACSGSDRRGRRSSRPRQCRHAPVGRPRRRLDLVR